MDGANRVPVVTAAAVPILVAMVEVEAVDADTIESFL